MDARTLLKNPAFQLVKPYTIALDGKGWISSRDTEWACWTGSFDGFSNSGFILSCQSTHGYLYDMPPTNAWGVLFCPTALVFGQRKDNVSSVNVKAWHKLGYSPPKRR